MAEITIRYNWKSDSLSSVSQIITYPDHVCRVLTMKRYQWDWIESAEQNDYPFYEVLRAALQLAKEFPSRRGWHGDVLHQTEFMLRTIIERLYQEQVGAANDPVALRTGC